jgi:hypothetical protein
MSNEVQSKAASAGEPAGVPFDQHALCSPGIIEVTGTATALETVRELNAEIEVEVRAAPKAGAGSTARELRNTVVRELRAAGMRDDELSRAASASLAPGGAANRRLRAKHSVQCAERRLLQHGARGRARRAQLPDARDRIRSTRALRDRARQRIAINS